MTHTTLTVPPEVLEEADIDLEAILQFTAVDGKITIEQLGAAPLCGLPLPRGLRGVRMMRMLRILGKRGRITIPYEIRQKLGFRPNDVLSFRIMDDRTVHVRRERLCNATIGGQRMKENLRILMVEPHKAPYEASVPHELTAMQQTVGGLIEVVRNGDGTLLVCNV